MEIFGILMTEKKIVFGRTEQIGFIFCVNSIRQLENANAVAAKREDYVIYETMIVSIHQTSGERFAKCSPIASSQILRRHHYEND